VLFGYKLWFLFKNATFTAFFTFAFFLDARDAMVDIVFVLGARNPHASRDFDTMKKIAQEMLRQPRVESTRHGFVTYGDKAQTRLTSDLPKEILTQLLDLVPWQKEGTRIDRGVVRGIELFNQPSRPNAKKVLVVFTNDKTRASDQLLDDARKIAENAGVKVVVIGLGSRVDPAQIRRLVVDNDDVILVDATGDEDMVNRKVKETADKITEISKKGS
jgi:nucleotide-binding universal stress UspA family protein